MNGFLFFRQYKYTILSQSKLYPISIRVYHISIKPDTPYYIHKRDFNYLWSGPMPSKIKYCLGKLPYTFQYHVSVALFVINIVPWNGKIHVVRTYSYVVITDKNVVYKFLINFLAKCVVEKKPGGLDHFADDYLKRLKNHCNVRKAYESILPYIRETKTSKSGGDERRRAPQSPKPRSIVGVEIFIFGRLASYTNNIGLFLFRFQ